MRALLLIAFLLFGTTAQAQQPESMAAGIQRAALDVILDRMPSARGGIDVSVLRAPTQEKAMSLELLSVDVPDNPIVPRGRLQVPVRVAEELIGTAMINVAHFDSVATLPASISSGDTVDASSLNYVWMETTRFSGDPMTPSVARKLFSAEVIAQRSLRADRPLRANDLGPRPAAETGDAVRMAYRRGGFALELNCKARERGQIGDIIRLYAPDSDTVYRARILGPGRAEWVETL